METVFMLHRYLLLGDVGTQFLVFVAIAWLTSTFIGFYLTLPPKGRRFLAGWKPAWRVQWNAPLRDSASTCIARRDCGCGSCCS